MNFIKCTCSKSGVYILSLDAKSLESGTHFKNTIKLMLAK